jgi:large subunit ribosomal protein L15
MSEMKLNTIAPEEGATSDRKRVGRGIGCGWGKTCGRGHKGQHSRSGGYHKVGFEGGQMPLQRRIPKFGFISRKSLVRAKIRLSDLRHVEGDVISLDTLKASNVIGRNIELVKIYLHGEIDRAVTVKGIPVSKGAKAAIEAAKGKVEA